MCATPTAATGRQQPSNTPSGSPANLGNRKLRDVGQKLGAAAVLIAFQQKRGKEPRSQN